MGTITKLPSGKYRAQVRRAGIYRSGTFNRKSEAQGFIATIEGSLNSATGTIVAPNGMTFATLCTAYVDQVQTGRSRRADLAKIAKGVLGPIPAGKLNALHLSEFVKQRLDAGITGQTLAGDLSAVSAVLKWARRVKQIQVDDTLAKNARASLSAQRINTRSNSRTRLPSPDELERITEHVEARPKNTLPMRDIVEFACTSAMRLGEICRIQIQDIDHAQRAVMVWNKKSPRMARVDQLVPLIPDAYNIVLRASQGRSEGPIFPYKPDTVGAAWQRACKALGIIDLHLHDCRHLGITNLFRRGLAIQNVAQVSGHADWKHLKRYTNLNARDFHNAFNEASK